VAAVGFAGLGSAGYFAAYREPVLVCCGLPWAALCRFLAAYFFCAQFRSSFSRSVGCASNRYGLFFLAATVAKIRPVYPQTMPAGGPSYRSTSSGSSCGLREERERLRSHVGYGVSAHGGPLVSLTSPSAIRLTVRKGPRRRSGRLFP